MSYGQQFQLVVGEVQDSKEMGNRRPIVLQLYLVNDKCAVSSSSGEELIVDGAKVKDYDIVNDNFAAARFVTDFKSKLDSFILSKTPARTNVNKVKIVFTNNHRNDEMVSHGILYRYAESGEYKLAADWFAWAGQLHHLALDHDLAANAFNLAGSAYWKAEKFAKAGDLFKKAGRNFLLDSGLRRDLPACVSKALDLVVWVMYRKQLVEDFDKAANAFTWAGSAYLRASNYFSASKVSMEAGNAYRKAEKHIQAANAFQEADRRLELSNMIRPHY